MFQLATTVIASQDFKRAIGSIEKTTTLKELPKVALKEFVTKDCFYRPNDSEFINSYIDINGKTVTIYALDFSKTIMVLSFTPQGEFQHSLYTTVDDDGFYLNEVFELISILGY